MEAEILIGGSGIRNLPILPFLVPTGNSCTVLVTPLLDFGQSVLVILPASCSSSLLYTSTSVLEKCFQALLQHRNLWVMNSLSIPHFLALQARKVWLCLPIPLWVVPEQMRLCLRVPALLALTSRGQHFWNHV